MQHWHLLIRKGKAKQGGLLGGDDDSDNLIGRQILGICLILDHQLGFFVHKRPKGDDCLLVGC